MKTIVQIIVSLVLAIPLFAKEDASSLAGSYLHRSLPGEPFSLLITLDLRPDGSYHAIREYCMVYGTAEGSWTIKDDKLMLSPKNETGNLQNYLRVFAVRRDSRGLTLLPEADGRTVLSEKQRELSSFIRFEEKKKA